MVPILVGFAISVWTTPAGVSGAFLLMPFQLSVLGFTAPGVTPTNLLYNVISTPGGIVRYFTQGDFDRKLVTAIVKGAIPGVVAGSFLRITVLDDPEAFKGFVGLVLLALGGDLVVQATIRRAARNDRPSPDHLWITVLGAGAGTVGGIYGISGGSIIAPVLVGFMGLPVTRVAPAALLATLLTSVAGVISFEVIDLLATSGPSYGPDWQLALLFGVGGAAGGNVGARLNRRVPERWLRGLLGFIAVAIGLGYLTMS